MFEVCFSGFELIANDANVAKDRLELTIYHCIARFIL